MTYRPIPGTDPAATDSAPRAAPSQLKISRRASDRANALAARLGRPVASIVEVAMRRGLDAVEESFPAPRVEGCDL